MKYLPKPDVPDLGEHLVQEHGATALIDGMNERFHDVLHEGHIGHFWHTHVKPKKEWSVTQEYLEVGHYYADTEEEALQQFSENRGTGMHEIHRFELPVVEEL